jgi:hypothetical protein
MPEEDNATRSAGVKVAGKPTEMPSAQRAERSQRTTFEEFPKLLAPTQISKGVVLGKTHATRKRGKK